MGGCCGKNAQPKDPDKSPYAATKKQPETTATAKERPPVNLYAKPTKTPSPPTATAKPVAVSPVKPANDGGNKDKAAVTPVELNGGSSGKQTAQVDKDNDSFVIIELPKDNESSPKVIEPLSKEAKPTELPEKKPESPSKKDDAITSTPKSSPLPPSKGVTPISLPKDLPVVQESIFSPRPIEAEVKVDVAASLEKAIDIPVKAAEELASKLSVPTTRDDSSSVSSTDDNIVSTPDVVLRIDEPAVEEKVEMANVEALKASVKTMEPDDNKGVIGTDLASQIKIPEVSASISVGNKSEVKLPSKASSPPKPPKRDSSTAASASFGFVRTPSLKKDKDDDKKDESEKKPKQGFGFSSFGSFTKKEVTKTVSSVSSDITKTKTSVKETVTETVKEETDSAKKTASSIKESASSALESALTVKETSSAAKDFGSSAKETVSSVLESAAPLKETASSAIEVIKEGATEVKDGVMVVKETVTTVKQDMSKIKEAAPAALKGAASIKDGAVHVKEGIMAVKEGGFLDKNQNKAEPVAEEKMETKAEVEVESPKSPTRGSKLPSPAPSGLRMPSINAKSPSLTSPTERKTTIAIRTSQTDSNGSTPLSPTDADKTEMVTPTISIPPIELKITEKTKDEDKTKTPELKIQSPVIVTSPNLTSKPKSPPPVASPKLPKVEQVNGTASSTEPTTSKPIPLLPDFTASNAFVTKKHTYCANTRTALLTTIDKRITESSQDDPRVTNITAEGGMGKTTLCKELCTKYADSIAAYHFFNYNNSDQNHNDFRSVLLWFVRCMIDKVNSYEAELPTDAKDIIANGSIEDVLQKLIYVPLQRVKRDSDKKMLVILDALDECYYADRTALLKFVDGFSSRAPAWLYLCVSVRNDNQFADKLSNVKNLTIKNNNDNMADMKRIMKESLGQFMDRISLDGGLTQLAKKTQGLPLCAVLFNRLLASLNKDAKIALREIDIKFATTIDGVLSNILSNFKKSLDAVKGADHKYAKLMGMLSCARQPIHQAIVTESGFKDSEEILDQLSTIVDRHDNEIVLMHRVIAEWILDQTRGDTLGVDANTAKAHAAEHCVRWLEPLMNESAQDANPGLVDYAAKHAVSHLIDKPKEQENVANVLCSLRVMQRKLKLSGAEAVARDYKHEHEQIDHSRKHVSLQEYMKKAPKIDEQIKIYKMLIKNNDSHLKYTPSALYQVAANYTKSPRIQQNARIELTASPWLEDLTAVEDSHCTMKSFSTEIVAANMSNDGKTLAFITTDAEKNVHLHQYNAHSLEPKIQLVDITNLNGLTPDKLLCKFLPDGVHIFVGSLQMLVDAKGKSVSSGYDVASIDIKEKFISETCAVSPKYLAVALTTFPFNGRSVHLSIIGIKEKKALKTIEVMKFRFGGNPQFGVKGCAISPDEKLLAACLKQNNKPEMKVSTWDMTKWSNLHNVNINCVSLVSCHFGESSTLLMNVNTTATENKCFAWKTSDESPVVISDAGLYSAMAVNKSHVAMCSVNRLSGTAKLSKWKRSQKPPGSTFRIHGVEGMSNIFIHSGLVITDSNSIKVFDYNDLEDDGTDLDNPCNVQLGDLNVESVAFMPRSDTLVINTTKQDEATVYICDSLGDGAQLKDTPMSGQILAKGESSADKVFTDRAVTGQNMFVSNDGTCYILNLRNKILLWSSSTDKVVPLPVPSGVGANAEALLCLSSPKDSLLAVVFSDNTHVVHLIDVKTMRSQRQIELEQSPITDISFMPSNGSLLTYQREAGNKFTIWNQRSGKQISAGEVDVFFIAVSHALDRLALSMQKGLQLRSSDSRVCAMLDTKGQWSGKSNECDASFSPDGTILIGVDHNLCRVWSAANGDLVQDIQLNYTGAPFIIGMPTNTHVAICDGRVTLVDLASGEILCVAPLPSSPYERSKCCLNVSPRGGLIAGHGSDGRAIAMRLHNFSAIKMKTSLQRMKSFRK